MSHQEIQNTNTDLEQKPNHEKEAKTTGLAGVDVDMEGQDDDSIECKEDEGVNRYGLPVRLQAAELHLPAMSRQLKQKPRLQKHEQYHPNHYRPPVHHFLRRKPKCEIWVLEKTASAGNLVAYGQRYGDEDESARALESDTWNMEVRQSYSG